MEKSSGLISFAQGWTFIRFHFTQSSLSFMAYMLSLSVCHGSSCAAASLCVVLRVIFNQVKLMKGLGAKFWYVWLFCPRYFSIKIFGWDFNQKIQRFWSFTNYWFWQKLQKIRHARAKVQFLSKNRTCQITNLNFRAKNEAWGTLILQIIFS